MKIIDILQKVNKLPLSPRDKGSFFEKLSFLDYNNIETIK